MARPKKPVAKKRTNGYYEAKVTVGYDIDGKPIRKSFYSDKSKEDAKEKGMRYMLEEEIRQERGEISKHKVLTFTQQALITLELKKNKVREITYNLSWHNTVYKHLIPYFGAQKLSTIKKNDIERYIIDHSDFSKATLSKHLICLREIFENAKDNLDISNNPCDNVKIETGKKQKERHVYTAEQAEYILEYCKQHRFGIDIDILLRYGVSRSELLGLRVSDVDFENKTISISRGVTVTTGKLVIGETKNEFRRRVIAVSDETLSMIDKSAEYLVHKQDGSVCRPDNWLRRHYNVFMQDMHRYYMKQGIDIPILTAHELRHTRASIWVNEGKNLFAIAEQMGWANLDMLRKRYGHGDINALRKELDL